MLLTYSLDRFVDMIKHGSKIHTIREDRKERWKPGMSIQHWRGNPRNVKANPYQFGTGICKSVQSIGIKVIDPHYNVNSFGLLVKVDGRVLTDPEIETLAINDGLSVAEFKKWFASDEVCGWFFGRIIHFTDLKY